MAQFGFGLGFGKPSRIGRPVISPAPSLGLGETINLPNGPSAEVALAWLAS